VRKWLAPLHPIWVCRLFCHDSLLWAGTPGATSRDAEELQARYSAGAHLVPNGDRQFPVICDRHLRDQTLAGMTVSSKTGDIRYFRSHGAGDSLWSQAMNPPTLGQNDDSRVERVAGKDPQFAEREVVGLIPSVAAAQPVSMAASVRR
jgi:hypothetical protein